MKKLKSLSLVALAALIVGCASPAPTGNTASGSGSGSSEPTANAKKLKIGVSIPAADHGWTGGVVWWAEECKKIYPNAEFNIQQAKTPAEQTSQIETILVSGIDGLVVLATESAPLTPVAKKVKEKGVFLVNVDRGFTEPVADVFIEGDNKSFGRTAAEFIVKKLNGKGKIVFLEGVPCTVNTDRVEAAKAVFSANPGIEVLDSAVGGWDRAKSLAAMQAMIQKHAQIDAVWAADDDMALGVEQALKEANRTNTFIIGGGGMKDVVKYVMDKNPMFPATVTYSPSMIAAGVQLCISSLEGGMLEKRKGYLPKHMVIDVNLITPENASSFYFPESIY